MDHLFPDTQYHHEYGKVPAEEVGVVEVAPSTHSYHEQQRESPRECDRGLTGKNWLLGGVTAVWILAALAGALAGVHLRHLRNQDVVKQLSGSATIVLIPLAMSALVTLCNECLGLVHTVALRWALWHEGRLHFNTNLRLIASARRSIANSFVFNIVYLLAVVFSYTSTAQLFQGVYSASDVKISMNFVALGVLAIALAVEALIATWSWLAVRSKILTWSSNSLNNSLVCLVHGMQRTPDRSMIHFRKAKDITMGQNPPMRPLPKQQTLFSIRLSARLTVMFLWGVCLATAVWGIVVLHTANTDSYSSTGFLHSGKYVYLSRFGYQHNGENNQFPDYVQKLITLFIVCAIQLYLTFGLHCAEILVNAVRDEKTWRRASRSKSGAATDQNAIIAALQSWETLVLAAFKILIHWAFGQAVPTSFVNERTDAQDDLIIESTIAMFPKSLFFLTGLLACLALFGTYLALIPPTGPQPAAWGHFQTIVDLVDDWGKSDEPLFWGDKGERPDLLGSGIRHAGTAASKSLLQPIQMDAVYY